MSRPVPAILFFLSSGVLLPAQGTLYDLNGNAPSSLFGSAVAGVGDVNDDCVPDFIVGVPGDDAAAPDAGSATVFSGIDGSVLFSWTGSAAGDAFGAAVAGAGDADGDGRADLIVGAPGNGAGGTDAGAAWLFSGATGAVLRSWTGNAGDALGSSVGGAGHVNRNGYADQIVGAPGGNYALVFDGLNGSVLITIAPAAVFGDAVGAAVAGIGDVNGDHFDDVLVGVPGDDSFGVDAGLVLVVSGRDGSTLLSLTGDSAGDALGTAVSRLGDVDLDGTPDFAAGAPGDDNRGADAGSVRVFSGSGAILYTLYGDFAGDALGTSVAAAGDVNGDGYADIVAGAPGNDRGGANAGAARVLSGRDGAILATWRGESAGDGLGSAVGGVGDASGDGYADVIAGAPGDDDAGSEAGSVRIFARAPFAGFALVRTLTPAQSPGLFGSGNESVGDVDNDGRPDYAIGAVSDLSGEGTIRVFSGADHSVMYTFTGGGPSYWFGPNIGAAGDVDGDGHADFLLGAQHYDVGLGYVGRARLHSGADGSAIWEWFGSQGNAHMGSALGGLGDIDGDSVPDVFVGLLKKNELAGAVRTYSGATGLMIYEVVGARVGDWLGSGGAALGDLDGDGISDFVVGAAQAGTLPAALAGYAIVLSGVDGKQLYRFDGLNPGDAFGVHPANAGDVNGDGTADIILGARGYDLPGKLDAGMARVYSGADGSILYHFEGEFAGDQLGEFTHGVGDVNGDGFDDFLIAAPGFDPSGLIAAGRVYLYSGLDGSLIQVFDGTMLLGTLGKAITGIGDTNGDGYADLSLGATGDATAGSQSGAAYIYESTVESDPGSSAIFGRSCPTSNGWLPVLTITGRPHLGSTFTVDLNPLFTEVNPLGLLRIGDSNTSVGGEATLPIRLEASLGCLVYTNRLVTRPFVPGLSGVSIPHTVQNVPSLVGFELFFQFQVFDPRKNLAGRVFSNAGKVKIGR